MNNRILKTMLAGIAATGVMTVVMFIAPMMGMPKMNPAAMLSMTTGMPLAFGWIMHFMIGIGFAFSYLLIFSKLLGKISNYMLKGALFGFNAFVLAQIGMAIMGLMLDMPPMGGNIMLMMAGSILGHVVFGIVVGLISKQNSIELALGKA